MRAHADLGRLDDRPVTVIALQRRRDRASSRAIRDRVATSLTRVDAVAVDDGDRPGALPVGHDDLFAVARAVPFEVVVARDESSVGVVEVGHAELRRARPRAVATRRGSLLRLARGRSRPGFVHRLVTVLGPRRSSRLGLLDRARWARRRRGGRRDRLVRVRAGVRHPRGAVGAPCHSRYPLRRRWPCPPSASDGDRRAKDRLAKAMCASWCRSSP